MRRRGIDKLALLAVLGAAAVVLLAAVGTGPAYSDDDPAQPAATAQVLEASAQTTAPSADGYQWSGSRPAAERYLWSQ